MNMLYIGYINYMTLSQYKKNKSQKQSSLNILITDMYNSWQNKNHRRFP